MLLIDCDRVMYTSAWVMEQGDEKFKSFIIDNLINYVFEVYKDKEYRMFLTSRDDSNFRIKLAKTREYKGNRKNKRKPIWIKEVRDYLIRKYNAEEVFDMEADDRICIEGYKAWKASEPCIVISDDKDLKQIPGIHGDFKGNTIEVKDELGALEMIVKKSGRRIRRILKGTGLKFLYSQMITGDIADDYPGIKDMGPVAAFNLLKDCNSEIELYNRTVDAFEGNIELMDEMGGLAYMLREEGDSWIKRKEGLLND